jgi:sirohydrochlorin ferrochelatase
VSDPGGRQARALVLVDHGSRQREAHVHLEKLAERVQALLPDWIVRIAHMEIASPTIAEAIDACAADGARRIVVYPLFVTPGRHLTHDIPDLVTRAAARHPGLAIGVSEPLGSAQGLPALIAGSLRAARVRL